MLNKKFFKTYVLVSAALLLIFPLLTSTSESAQDPSSVAYYSPANDRLFWFIQVSDLHINVEKPQSSSNLTWLVGEARTAIDPEFIVATGDLTDSVLDSGFDIPNGPWESEWIEYRQILLSHGINSSNYYDIPGNHDAYNDQFFDYYLANSIQGPFHQGRTQFSWVRNFIFGNYHFLGVNTAGNDGRHWSFSWPHGDLAGLDSLELPFIQEELELHSSATLSMIFGHHPLRNNGDIGGSTYLQSYYEEISPTPLHESGADEFIDLMDFYDVSMYGYGHVHAFSEQFFTEETMTGEGVYYLAVDTLGKLNENNYNIIAIDSNGISIRNKSIGSWPAVVITAPVDVDLGVVNNPYTYNVPDSSANPIRALVFDSDVNSVTSVQYRIRINGGDWNDLGGWQDMVQVPVGHVNYPHLWEAPTEAPTEASTGVIWDASELLAGHYNIEVQASSASGTDSDTISTNVYQQSEYNHPPVANNIVHSINKGDFLDVPAPGVLANDYDPDFDPITAFLDSGPVNGTLKFFNADGSFDYTPYSGFSGLDSFTYTVSDGSLRSDDPATVTIIVNDPPVAVDDSYSTDGARLEVAAPGVLGNDSDLDEGDMLIATLVSGPSYGSLTLNPDGSFDYTPDPAGFTGDTFTYKASDGMAYSNVATVVIAVGAANIPPVANEGSATTPKDTPVGITLSAFDPDNGPLSLTYTVVTPPARGSLSGTAPELIYTPNGFIGTDSFNFKVYDGQANSNVATVSITVNAVNIPPVAVDDSYDTDEDTTLNVLAPGVLGNDSDFEGDTLTAILVSGPSNGSLTLNPDGSFDYTPGSSFTGTASFTYKANDGAADSNPAIVTITVNAVNIPPVAVDDSYDTYEDTPLTVAASGVLANDSDFEGGMLTAILDSGPSNGSLTLNPDGSFVYKPNPDFNGSDSFTYTANDGPADSNTATVTITVNPVNDPPVAVDDSYDTDEDTTLIVPVLDGVLANDSDPDTDDTITAVLASGPSSGILTLNSNGSFEYIPDSGFTGASFSYKANDGAVDSKEATVTITVTPVNDPPVADSQAVSTDQDTPLDIHPLRLRRGW